MALLDEWAITLASAAAPTEVDFAPAMARAYAAGGAARRELLAEATSTPGGFGAGELPVFAFLLSGVASTATALRNLLDNHELVKNLLTAVTVGISVSDFRFRLKQAKGKEALKTPDGATVPAPSAAQLSAILETVSSELKKSGLDEDECDVVTLRVLRALLSKPESASAFVAQLKQN